MNFKELVLRCLLEGDGVEGYDLPIRYPLVSGRDYKKVTFPASFKYGTKPKVWYIETNITASNSWAIYRAAAAQLKRDGVSQDQITQKIHKFVRDFPPTVKLINTQEIPDNTLNVIKLK
jgi:hypothetical protein